MNWLLVATLPALLAAAAGGLAGIIAWWRLPRLDTGTPTHVAAFAPAVSVIVPARDEAATIEPAMCSLLAQDWPELEIIAVDDRSGDATGEILERLAVEDARLAVLHIDTLPDGWLGKTHAMHEAAQRARGEWLLFTDADVTLRFDAISAAMARAREARLDHLALVPRLIARGGLLRAVLLLLSTGIFLRFMDWRGTGRGFGIGAFNLVRADAWHRSGGHAAIALAVVDDMALGQQLERAGCRQGVALALDHVSVEWYPDIRSLSQGLEKNVFAGMGYRLPVALAGIALLALTMVWPFVALVLALASDAMSAAWVAFAAITMLAGAVAHAAVRLDWGLSLLAWWPVAGAVAAWIIARAVVLTLYRGGIRWRGSFYSLAELRAGSPRF